MIQVFTYNIPVLNFLDLHGKKSKVLYKEPIPFKVIYPITVM